MDVKQKTEGGIEQTMRFLEKKKVQTDRDVENYITHADELERRRLTNAKVQTKTKKK